MIRLTLYTAWLAIVAMLCLCAAVDVDYSASEDLAWCMTVLAGLLLVTTGVVLATLGGGRGVGID